MTTKRILGIDLGTTYSCVACLDEIGKPIVLQNSEGDLTTPSVVYFEGGDNIVVGKQAKNVSKLYPGRVVEFVKRQMGEANFSYEVDGKDYKPEEISSFILRKLVKDASETLGEQITDVVITCPAYFGSNERKATQNAGALADLNVLQILNEPTAAAIFYGLDKSERDQVVLVYDLGGGTFDITVIAMKEGNIHVVVTGGNKTLGGKDWDDHVTRFLAGQFVGEHPDKGDPLDDDYSAQELAKMVEEAKKGLSATERTRLMISHGGERVQVDLTRQKFEEITAALLDETIEITKRVLAEAEASDYSQIDKILLVGGSSRMPYVARRIKETFGGDIQILDPDLAVAKGAALMGRKIMVGELFKEVIAGQEGITKEEVRLENLDAQTLEQAAKEASAKAEGVLRLSSKELVGIATRTIQNVCSQGCGVVVVTDEQSMEESVAYLIHKNTPVPVEITEDRFGTLVANQRSVQVRVVEQSGETESAAIANSHSIGEGDLTGLPPNLPAGTPIHVTFQLDENGALQVTAVEPSSGQRLKIDIEVQGVMSQQEVEQKKGLLMKKTIS